MANWSKRTLSWRAPRRQLSLFHTWQQRTSHELFLCRSSNTHSPTCYLRAQEAASNSNQKTLTASHVLQAIETIGFGSEFGPLLNEALEGRGRTLLFCSTVVTNMFFISVSVFVAVSAFKKQVAQAKEAKSSNNAEEVSERIVSVFHCNVYFYAFHSCPPVCV